MRTLIVKSACRSQSAPTSRAIGQYPVYFFCKFFKTPNSSVDGVALFWKGGLATGVAGGQISAPLMRAGKDPASRAVAGWDWPAWGLGWRVGARPPWAGLLRGAGLLRRGGCVPSAVRGSGRSGCGAGGLAAEAGARGSVAVLLRLDMVPHGHAAGV